MVFQNQILAGASSAEDYEIEQSCRFNDDDSPYLIRTFGTPTSSSQFGYSVWTKRSNLGYKYIISATDGSGNNDQIYFSAGNVLVIQEEGNNRLVSDQLFRDSGAWYHFLFAYDLGNGTNAYKLRVYLNGEEITSWSTDTRSSYGSTSPLMNAAVQHTIGDHDNGPTAHIDFYDGYFAECNFVDGTVLTPAMFGETNSTTGQWIPKEFTGTYGDNGFLLAFQDSSALGDDTSGEGNDFTSSGLAAADQVVDTPTDNFCTWNPVNPQPAASNTMVLSDGNLNVVQGSTANQNVLSTHQLHGKQYVECKLIGSSNAGGTRQAIGVIEENTVLASGSMPNGSDTFSGMAFPLLVSYSDGTGDPAEPDYGALANGETLGFAISEDDGKFWCRVNDGDWLGGGDPETTSSTPTGTFSNITTGQWVVGCYNASDNNTSDFGQLGYAYTAPSGYETVSTSKLSAPTIADPSAYFQPTIYTGDGASSLAVVQGGNSQFEPNLVWIKNRDADSDRQLLTDSVRGVEKSLYSSSTSAEVSYPDGLESFTSTGFTVGSDVEFNTNTEKYVAWQWLESATPGFDIVSYDGTGVNRTVSHNLGVKPDMMVFKRLDGTQNWPVYHSFVTATGRLILDLNHAEYDDNSFWNDTEPTSSVFTLGNDGAANGDGQTQIGYLWAGVDGFSKFGSFIGNGDTDGPFVWCGFRPAYILIKSAIGATENWVTHDNQRGPYNVIAARLEPNNDDDEATNIDAVDFLSNGFKLRTTDGMWNGDGNTFVFAAWAETPFKTANAR